VSFLTPAKESKTTVIKLDVPIVNERQSAHDIQVIDLDTAKPYIKITGTLKDPGYAVRNGDMVFGRALHGLRNTVLLPAGWEVSAVSQSGTIGTYQSRAFVSFINLNGENTYRVTIHARRN
jgi:hypothetical protein